MEGKFYAHPSHLIEVLNRFADDNGLGLYPPHQVLDVSVKVCLVLNETRGYIVIGITLLKLRKEGAVRDGGKGLGFATRAIEF